MATPIPYKGTESFIFVSYSHDDSGAVWEIIANMQASGFRVWFDQGVDPGTEWAEFIANKVIECGYFIAFVSRNYIGSENCRNEINYARGLGKRRLLVYLEDVQLTPGMAMNLNSLQAIYKNRYADEREFYERLFSAEEIGLHRGPQPKPASPDPIVVTVEKAFTEGKKLYDAKDYALAVKYLRPAADEGHETAQIYLATCFFNGFGVEEDRETAVKYFRMAAEQGNQAAKIALLTLGKTVETPEASFAAGKKLYEAKKYAAAAAYLRSAADRGHAAAQTYLATCYFNGWGVETDRGTAAKYFRMAAAQGDPAAKNALKALGL